MCIYIYIYVYVSPTFRFATTTWPQMDARAAARILQYTILYHVITGYTIVYCIL